MNELMFLALDEQISDLPSSKNLAKLLSRKGILYSNHVWSSAEILGVIRDLGRLRIYIKRICEVCGSVRKSELWYYSEGGYWEKSEGYITHSEMYKHSTCLSSYRTRQPVGITTRHYPCVHCGHWHFSLSSIEVCKKKHDEKRFREEQIKKNLKIIEIAKETFRRNLAIYRLYRYCNFTPLQLEYHTGMSRVYVKGIIGEVFRFLCMSDKKCVFQKYLKIGK